MLKHPLTVGRGFRCSCLTPLGLIASFLTVGAPVRSTLAQSDPPDAVAVSEGGQEAVWGCVNGTHAYSLSGGVGNIGLGPLPGHIGPNHAVLAQNLYRLSNVRFQQIGMSWVKHTGWVTEINHYSTYCGGSPSCMFEDVTNELGPGCVDIYLGCANGEQHLMLGPRSQINPATTGTWWPVPAGVAPRYCDPADGAIACRLQVKKADLDPLGTYFLEQQVVTPAEPFPSPETRNNNVSYTTADVDTCQSSLCNNVVCQGYPFAAVRSCIGTECTCLNSLTVDTGGYCQKPAIRAWRASDPCVVETDIQVDGDGHFILAAKAVPVDSEWWSYEYALYNMNSDRAADGFRVALPADLPVSTDVRNLAFHDVDYHSGDGTSVCVGGVNDGDACGVPPNCPDGTCSYINYDPTDWSSIVDDEEDEVRWAAVAAAPPENANALRWGTLYNFRFEAKRAPYYASTVTIDLFKTGTPASITANSVAPAPLAPPEWECLVVDPPEAFAATNKNRFLSIVPGCGVQTAIRVTMVDLQHPRPANVVASVPRNFTSFDTRSNGVCSAGSSRPAHHCDADADCRVCDSGSGIGLPCTVNADCRRCVNDRDLLCTLNSDCDSVGGNCGIAGTCSALSGTCSPLTTCTAEAFPAGATGVGGCARWVGKPATFLEAQDTPAIGSFRASRLQCTPYYQDWSLEPVIHITGAEILPSSEYSIELIALGCSVADEDSYSPEVTMKTSRHGDVFSPFNPPSATTQPDVTDLSQVVNKFKNGPGASIKPVALIQPNLPDLNTDVSVSDIVAVVDAAKQFAYPYGGPCPCPSAKVCGTACSAGCGGGENTCLKRCRGGTNVGEFCNNHKHCEGGGICDKECVGGTNNGQGCTGPTDCGKVCVGGSTPGAPCEDAGQCGAGTCPPINCTLLTNNSFCYDQCGRCTP